MSSISTRLRWRHLGLPAACSWRNRKEGGLPRTVDVQRLVGRARKRSPSSAPGFPVDFPRYLIDSSQDLQPVVGQIPALISFRVVAIDRPKQRGVRTAIDEPDSRRGSRRRLSDFAAAGWTIENHKPEFRTGD